MKCEVGPRFLLLPMGSGCPSATCGRDSGLSETRKSYNDRPFISFGFVLVSAAVHAMYVWKVIQYSKSRKSCLS